MTPIRDILGRVGVIPVLQIDAAEQAVPLAGALIEAGLSVLEVTLRTDAALDAARAIKMAHPQALVGLGTLTRAEDLAHAVDIQADFAVSPGLTPSLAEAARNSGVPFLPGVSTMSEAMTARELGYCDLKLFPARELGGVSALNAMGAVLPDVRFCPTGGVSALNLMDYMSLPNVFAVGGSWLTPAEAVAAGEWDKVGALGREALALAVRAKGDGGRVE